MTDLSQNILKLRNEGLSYNEISKKLNCSKATISYHCSPTQKFKNYERVKKYRNKSHPYLKKLYKFRENLYKSRKSDSIKSSFTRLLTSKLRAFNEGTSKNMITIEQVIEKFGENPKCYLSGKELDIYKPSTYEFDHIIPRSREGDNSIENLGICTKQINRSKGTMTPDEFINMCKKVIKHANPESNG